MQAMTMTAASEDAIAGGIAGGGKVNNQPLDTYTIKERQTTDNNKQTTRTTTATTTTKMKNDEHKFFRNFQRTLIVDPTVKKVILKS
jgi:hypothetical protein